MDAPFDNTPAWSPDGSKIAFARSTRSGTRLYVIQPNGRGLRRLTTVPAFNPSWSPDSKRLVFDTGRRIAVVNDDGGHLQYLTQPPGDAKDVDPAWSPDGRSIAFVRRGNIWIKRLDEGSARLLIKNALEPAWRRR